VVSSSKTSPYRRSVLFISILRVLDAEHLTDIDVDNLVDTIEQKIIIRGQDEIEADLIRRLCLDTLKAIDMNAFMRYMALHMNFRTKSDLKAEMKKY
jgi:transcriptional regulator NrdR family protein